MIPTNSDPAWYLYILDCDGRYYYTGITTDVERRLCQHRRGKTRGARATRGFQRIEPAYTVAFDTRALAQRAEYRLKKLLREEKRHIVEDQPTAAQLLRRLGVIHQEED